MHLAVGVCCLRAFPRCPHRRAARERASPVYQRSGEALPGSTRQAVQLYEQAGDLYGAARTRLNVAIALARAGRRADALEYAEAALRGFEPYGAGAAEDIENTRRLMAEIRGA